MKKFRGMWVVAGLAATLAVAVACGSGNGDNTPSSSVEPIAQPPVGVPEPSVGAPEPAIGAPSGGVGVGPAVPGVDAPALPPVAIAEPVPLPPIESPNSFQFDDGDLEDIIASSSLASSSFGFAAPGFGSSGFSPSFSPFFHVDNPQSGIWVTGDGVITVEPDLAQINIGVESQKPTVSEARDDAARAMDAIVAVLHNRGVEDKDIRTRFFNISPRFEFREVFEEGRRTGKQELVGYQVSNSVTINIRDLDAVGEIIDEVTTAGGNAIRVNGISFTIEDPRPMMAQLRELAVRDALAKADQFASLTSVSLGQLMFISETGGGRGIVQQSFDERIAFAGVAAPVPATAISGGELDLRLSVQAIFAIIEQ